MGIASILIVEDESMVSEYLRSQLEKSDYDVVDEVKSGENALDVVEEQDVDVILMDIKLEGELNGVETAQKINEDHNSAIIYVTAYSDNELIEQAKLTEPAGYLIKPIEQDDLLCTIAIARHNRRLKEERKQALEERDRALEEKEKLLNQIKDIVENNLSVMSELMDLQKNEEDLFENDDIRKEGLDIIESMTKLQGKLESLD